MVSNTRSLSVLTFWSVSFRQKLALPPSWYRMILFTMSELVHSPVRTTGIFVRTVICSCYSR
jgi:hypothetical protein